MYFTTPLFHPDSLNIPTHPTSFFQSNVDISVCFDLSLSRDATITRKHLVYYFGCLLISLVHCDVLAMVHLTAIQHRIAVGRHLVTSCHLVFVQCHAFRGRHLRFCGWYS